MIEITNLVKNYGNHKAVKDVSFVVPKGQVVGLLGPNGAGKSTTMNIMTGYLPATSGTVKIGDFDISKNPDEAKRLIGYLPEIPPLYMDMTVMEYLEFVAELKGVKKADRKEQLMQVMQAASIEEKAGRLIKNLSKGYRQRVGLSAALLGNPQVLILDEPTVGLDPNQIIEIRQLIKKLGKNHTVILSSHILSEVSAICDSIVIIDKGMVVAKGTPEDLSEHFSKKNMLLFTIKGKKNEIEQALKESQLIISYEITGEEEDKKCSTSSTKELEKAPDSNETKHNEIETEGVEKKEDLVIADEENPQTEEKIQKEKIYQIQVYTDQKEDIRDALFYEFADRKIPIYRMEYDNMSLEEVFIKLTNEEETEHESNL